MNVSRVGNIAAVVLLSVALAGAQAGLAEGFRWAGAGIARQVITVEDLLLVLDAPLSTKCGIQFMVFGDELYETSPLGDGKPPPGWPSSVAFGTLGRGLHPFDELELTSKYEPSPIIFRRTDKTWPPCP